jgi:predicted nucleic acid-binding protein
VGGALGRRSLRPVLRPESGDEPVEGRPVRRAQIAPGLSEAPLARQAAGEKLGLLHLLPSLIGRIVIPPAVQEEIAIGRAAGVDLPALENLEWLILRRPASESALPLITDLGPGEAEVLLLALEFRDSTVILDDGLARQVAQAMEIRLTGTLGLLLDAKRRGLVASIAPFLEWLQELRFRLASSMRGAVLKLAGEP